MVQLYVMYWVFLVIAYYLVPIYDYFPALASYFVFAILVY